MQLAPISTGPLMAIAVICLETLYGQTSIIHWLQVGQLSANQKLVIEFTENICNFLHSPGKEKQKRKTYSQNAKGSLFTSLNIRRLPFSRSISSPRFQCRAVG